MIGRILLSLAAFALAGFLLLVLIGLWDGYEQETKALGFSGLYERYLAPQAGFADDPKAYRAVVEAERARTAGVGEIGAVNSPRSAAKRPINSSSSSAPEGQRRGILTSTARERLLASGRRNPMSSSSRSSLRARSTRVGAVPTELSRLRERVTIWRCSGLAVSKPTQSSLTAHSQKSSMPSDALASRWLRPH